MGTLLRDIAQARHGRRVLVIAVVFAVVLSGLLFTTQRRSEAVDFSDQALLPPGLRIVDVGIDQAEQLAAPLRAIGFGVETYSPVGLDSAVTPGVWWITQRAVERISPDSIEKLRRTGSKILLEGVGERATQALKLRVVPQHTTTKRGRMNGVALTWDPAITLRTPGVPGKALATTDAKTPALFLTEDQSMMWALPVLSEDPNQLPYLAKALRDHWDVRPRVERSGFDIFIDPDDHPTLSSKELVGQLSQAGVRRIYLAGWKRNVSNKFLYDYKTFVNDAHAVDLQVFAWLSWPYVDFSFWTEHPHCRERTANGMAARVNWRELAAVELPECFEHAWKASDVVLKSADFDGTIITDLFFESPYFGYREPKYYTPFHPEVRRTFKDKFGYDPKSLAKKGSGNWKNHPKRVVEWENYRAELLRSIYDKLLGRLGGTYPDRITVVSLMDDRIDRATGPLLASNSGQHSQKILSLRDRHKFELQIGDSLAFRKVDLEGITGQYPVRRNEPIVGVNADGRPPKPTPGSVSPARTKVAVTTRPVGLELSQLIGLASGANPIVTLSGSNLSLTNDLPWVRHSMAGANVNVIEVGPLIETTSNHPFRLLLNGKPDRITIDGRLVPLAAFVEVPAGRHIVEIHRNRSKPSASSDEPEILGDRQRDMSSSVKTKSPIRPSNAPVFGPRKASVTNDWVLVE